MAEGTKINPPTMTGGDTIDTEQVGAVKIPRSKIVIGARDLDGGDVASDNPMPVVVSGTPTVEVGNFPGTQPVSAASLPLPVGAAQDASLLGGAAKAQPVDASGNVLGTSGHPVRTDPVGTTAQPISAAALPLPAGAALASAQTDGSQKVQVVDAAGHHQPAGDAAARALIVALSDAIGAILGTVAAPLRTDPTGTTTQPVSGSVSVTNLPATQAISAVALPLPAGAALDATLKDGSAKVEITNFPVVPPVSGSVEVSNFPGTQPISAASLPLPAGAATDAAIAARLGTLGQKTSAASAPVVLASDQATLPVAGVVAVSNLPGTQPVSAASLPLPAGAAQDATITARLSTLGQKTSVASAPVVLASDQSAVPVAGTVAVSNLPTTQPISATSLPLPTGAALDATISARLGTVGQKAMVGSAPVVLASDQSAVPVSGSVTANLGTVAGLALDATLTGGTQQSKITDGTNILGTTAHPVKTDPTGTTVQPVSVASLPLPAGAALDATLTARLGTLGQKTGVASAPVVLASDQSAVPVSGTVAISNFPATQPVSAASLPLPAGAAQDATLTARLGTLGQKTSAGSAPVTIASDQSALAISAASLPLPAGAALDATLTSGTMKARITDGTNTATVKAASTAAGATDPALVVAISPNNTVPISAASLPLPAGAAQDATLTGGTQKSQVVDAAGHVHPAGDAATRPIAVQQSDGAATYVGAKTGQLPAALGAAVSASSLAVVVASDQAAIPVTTTPTKSTTGTCTNVAGATASTVLLASNAARKGACIYNDSTAILYVKLGVTASLTSFSVPIQPSQYFELGFNYTGEIDGIWSAAAGAARVTELT